jgi:hypothetical protein
MYRLYLSLFVALLILAVPEESAGQYGGLTELSEVKIVVEELSLEEKKLGLSEDQVKNHIFVLLQSKLRRRLVKDSVDPYIYVNINVGITDGGAYYGTVQVDIYRQVTINKTGRIFLTSVWSEGISLTGPEREAVNHVRSQLDQLLTGFASAWYRDNPNQSDLVFVF